VALLCDRAIWLRQGVEAASGPAVGVVRRYEAFLQEKEKRAVETTALPAATNGRQLARLTDVVVHDGSGYSRAEFGWGETLSVDVAFETADPKLAFHVRVGVDREDGVQVFAMDTRGQPWAPLTGQRNYRVRLTLSRPEVAQGEFRLYAFLADETALHLHDMRILEPGFSVVPPDYTVGLLRPAHGWSLEAAETEAPAPSARSRSASS
jgi:hypothetical protein